MAEKPRTLIKTYQNKIILLTALGFFIFTIMQGMSQPYVGYHAWNFNVYSLIAHNYNKFGILNTQFAPIISVSETLPENPVYYLHHPQLLSLTEAIFFKVFGESFEVGRFTVIMFSVGSLLLIYLIGKNTFNSRFGLTAATLYAVIPASVLFGRMIGQEPLVLFFVLLTTYCLVEYLETKRKIFHVLLYVSIVLGTLSDWPVTYFSLCLLPYLWVRKKIRLGINLILTSTLVALVFLLYLQYFGELGNLIGAFMVRSPGEIMSESFWFVRWIMTVVVRFFFYFNPVIFVLSIIGIITTMQRIKVKKIEHAYILLLCLSIFGCIHILLYPEGSFGHPYWIYYLLPSVVFFATLTIEKMGYKNIFILLLIFFSVVYLFGINSWKIKEIESNVFRYDLAKKAVTFLYPYEKILINNESVIDPDTLLYPFMHEVTQEKHVASTDIGQYRHMIYSCRGVCGDTPDLAKYKMNYEFHEVKNKESQAYIFNLQRTKSFGTMVKNNEIQGEMKKISAHEEKISIPKKLYKAFLERTGAPQL
jgi:hypothetical protein